MKVESSEGRGRGVWTVAMNNIRLFAPKPRRAVNVSTLCSAIAQNECGSRKVPPDESCFESTCSSSAESSAQTAEEVCASGSSPPKIIRRRDSGFMTSLAHGAFSL